MAIMAPKTSRRKRIGPIPKRRNERLKYNLKNQLQSNQQDSNAHDVDHLSHTLNSKNGTNDNSKVVSSHQSSSSNLQCLPAVPAVPAYILEHDYATTSAKTLENTVPEDKQLTRDSDIHQESVPENKEEVPLQELVLNVKEKLRPFLPRQGFTPIFNFHFP